MSDSAIGPATADSVVEALTETLRKTAADVVPWFLEQMPETYFHDTPADTVQDHLRAICAAWGSGLPLSLTLISKSRDDWTFIRETDRTGLLAGLIRRLPHDRVLRSAKIHSSRDGQLAIDAFSCRPSELFDPDSAELVARREAMVEEVAELMGDRSRESIAEHLARCTTEYVLTVTAYRVAANLRLYEAVSGTDDVLVDLERFADDPARCRVAIAAGNAEPRDLFERVCTALSAKRVDIRRAHLESMDDGDNGFVSVISLVVRPPELWALDGPEWNRTATEITRLRWLDDRALRVATEDGLSFEEAEVLVALVDLVHQWLSPQNPYLYTRNRVLRLARQASELTRTVVEALQARFDPDGDTPVVFAEKLEGVIAEAEAAGPREMRAVVRALAEVAGAVVGTNLHRAERYALALSLDPRTLHQADETRPLPHAVVFGHGRDFAAFHVRFRNIARGGLRVVRTHSAEGHAREGERLYGEAFSLAHAQQLKNKDIPEGGAKGVILAAPGASVERVVKAFGDALLDVTLAASSDERLYLGPDENISDGLIEWLVARARRRGHPVPDAFMSSKPGAGINHKRYGVTSEGVIVFLEEALRAIGVDPRAEPFTVKLTGGPDGDVAGNALRILNREFGDRVRVVGIADGSGSAEDPDGLAMEELLRLVGDSAPIADFDAARLGPKGQVLPLESGPGALVARNTLHSRVAADAFLPCGGRPATLNGQNWPAFLTAGGEPSSRVIVEGANLFVTEDARRALATEAGVVVVKDSSANKCGVITSSFEIAASMLLDEEGFLAIKEAFVGEVLERLRTLARQEAALLFRLHRRHPDRPLSEASVRVSAAINRATDAVVDALATSKDADREGTRGLVLEHLPPSLVAAAGDDLLDRLPAAYLDRVVASSLAADLVYREGDAFFEGLDDQAVGRLALRYLRESRRVRALIAEVEASDLPNRDAIVSLLDRGGRRAAVESEG
jgi:glutamate dehydrogenase